MSAPRLSGLLLGCLLTNVAVAGAQGWRLRFDAAAQGISIRGITADSVASADVVTTSGSGPVTAEGYAVTCGFDDWCRYYRAGAIRTGIPASASLDLAMWGLGITGLSVRVNALTLGELSGNQPWPGTTPAFRLVEGYAEYLRGGLTARAGRMRQFGRLSSTGSSGLDGLHANWRTAKDRLAFGAYAGWGLARGSILPVTSPAVNPLSDFQPAARQIVVGGLAGLHLASFDAEAEYRRELDPLTKYLVAERAALSVQYRPLARVRLLAGSDYDLAQGRIGSAEATLAYTGMKMWATVGAKHYRPFFDLWTVWGVFSPVPYNGVNASVAVTPLPPLRITVNGEWFRYDDAAVSAPSVPLEDRGYRWGVAGSFTPRPGWTLDVGGHGEILPGASSSGVDGRVSWQANARLGLSVNGGSLQRPLEFRFQDAGVTWAGGAVDYQFGQRWRAGISADRYWESRDRADALAFDWNQWRLSARMSLTLRSSADRWQLPPARPAP